MAKEKFIMFDFPQQDKILVKYACNENDVSRDEIEDAVSSYLDSDIYDEDTTFEDIITDVMSSFNGLSYSLVNFSTITI